ncbi:MAG: hypothetical protein J0H31_13990 [Alphaproteobacteria bacterium]|nr:hypothetical protein [Alphaproteobacteria bacterium]
MKTFEVEAKRIPAHFNVAREGILPGQAGMVSRQMTTASTKIAVDEAQFRRGLFLAGRSGAQGILSR